jgi:hypothetical protein
MSEQKTAKRNWHSIVGPNGMCECGVDAAGVVTTCGQLHQAEVLAGPEACQHGTAMDVHCCHCHSGFIFDVEHECPPIGESAAEKPSARIDELMLWTMEAKGLPDSTVISVGYWTDDPLAMLGQRFDAVIRTTLGDLRKQFPPVQGA